MANLSESSDWVDAVYELATDDPVSGGAVNLVTKAGIDNHPHAQLAARTRWARNQIMALAQALAELTPEELLEMIKTVDGEGSGLDANLFDGLGVDAFWKTADGAAILEPNGTQFLPSGLILNWGTNGGGRNVSFRTPFPASVFSINITDRSSELLFVVESYDVDGFTIGPGGQGNYTAFWWAVGV